MIGSTLQWKQSEAVASLAGIPVGSFPALHALHLMAHPPTESYTKRSGEAGPLSLAAGSGSESYLRACRRDSATSQSELAMDGGELNVVHYRRWTTVTQQVIKRRNLSEEAVSWDYVKLPGSAWPPRLCGRAKAFDESCNHLSPELQLLPLLQQASRLPLPPTNMPPKPAEDTTPKAHWIEAETTALIDGLIAKKSTHQSGNGWKPSVWAGVIALVAAANPDASPKKDQTKCISKINYACSPSTPPALKEKFEAYLFVKKYSGIGWDDEDHHATATEEVIKTFLEAHGTKQPRQEAQIKEGFQSIHHLNLDHDSKSRNDGTQ
ncbi:hypothetical protein DFH08DRAFT_802444 [Mycena albidolilacea]|uniref:Myb/SANT-like domain-containing protein n=2 Tax=Mycena albidolilacea TaxID=1033008 RepID=A0AAD7AET9_9AGAR|nr:hypothetical protein DFH08DRAFT_802444 [Mycena albidolilacea]